MKEAITLGIDLGDRKSMICELDAEGRQLSMQNVSTSSAGLRKYLRDKPSCLIALEAGTHSAWISRQPANSVFAGQLVVSALRAVMTS